MGYYIDEKKKRYGTLTVLSFVDNGVQKHARWKCQCDCGRLVIRRGDRLRRGEAKGCKCSRKEYGRNPAANKVWREYKWRAKKRMVPFEIARDVFDELTKLPCHYCGAQPATVRQYSGHEFVYNGIDRMDNGRGYVMGNVTPCCWPCNALKSNRDYKEFLNQIAGIARCRNL